MQPRPQLTDRQALTRFRRRAASGDGPELFLHREAADLVDETLSMVNRTFTAPAVVAPFADFWHDRWPEARVVEDAEVLSLPEGGHDLVVHALALHWADDPLGQMIQARRALAPDGLFLAVLFGGRTLQELRAALAEAEVAETGGLSPRVAPMAEIRDLGALLQRAGFALPVASSQTLTASYGSALALMAELRRMGEVNALAARSRKPVRPAIIRRAAEIYATAFGNGERVPATFELILLTGWAPSPDQPRPLRPGSAQARLADALNAAEVPLPDKTGPAGD